MKKNGKTFLDVHVIWICFPVFVFFASLDKDKNSQKNISWYKHIYWHHLIAPCSMKYSCHCSSYLRLRKETRMKVSKCCSCWVGTRSSLQLLLKSLNTCLSKKKQNIQLFKWYPCKHRCKICMSKLQSKIITLPLA